VVFLDEAGLPKEKVESLKAIHYWIDDGPLDDEICVLLCFVGSLQSGNVFSKKVIERGKRNCTKENLVKMAGKGLFSGDFWMFAGFFLPVQIRLSRGPPKS